MKIILSYLTCSVIGSVICLLYHGTAIYSYGPAKWDSQYGWPFRYGFDQNDVVGEFFYNLSSFDWVACTIDAVIGFIIGSVMCYVALCFYKKRKPNQRVDLTR